MSGEAIQFDGPSVSVVPPTGASEDGHCDLLAAVGCGEGDTERLRLGIVLIPNGGMFEVAVDALASA